MEMKKRTRKVRRVQKAQGTWEVRRAQKAKVKRNYKDSMFRAIFKDKENLLSLYNAIQGSNHKNVDDLEINTLENAIYIAYKNDISFMIDTQLYLLEHQSSINPNIPLRNLFYVSEVLQNITKDMDLYSRTLRTIPTPRFIMFYNGPQEKPERWELRLSKAFKKKIDNPQLELVVTVININLGKNKELMAACKTLHDYAVYVQKVRDYTKVMTLENATGKAIDECIEEGILADFLKKHRAEAKNLSRWYEYDEEKHIREERKIAREEGWRTGWKKGQKSGWKKGQRAGERHKLANQVLKKMKKNYTVPEIADMLEEDESSIRRIYDVARKYAPDYDVEKVMRHL